MGTATNTGKAGGDRYLPGTDIHLLSNRLRRDSFVTLFFVVGSLVYGFLLWFRGFYGMAVVCLINSLVIVAFHLGHRLRRESNYQVLIFYFLGSYFVLFNVFGSGNDWNAAIILWVLLIVNFAFYALSQKHALLFSVIVVVMITLRIALVSQGISLPYVIPRNLVDFPTAIDVLIPGLFNLFLVFSTYSLYHESVQELKRSHASVSLLNSELDRSRRAYWSMVEKSPEYIIRHTLAGNIKFVNSLVASKLGVEPNCLTGRHITDIFTSVSAASLSTYLEKLVQTGNAEGFFKKGIEPDEEFFSYRSTLISDETGESIGLLFASDATEMEISTRNALRQVEELVAALSSSSDITILADGKGVIHKCWPIVGQQLQLNVSPGGAIFDAMRPLLRENFSLFAGAFERATKHFREDILSLPARVNGAQKYLDIKVVPVSGELADVSVSISITDVTDRHQAEENARIRLGKLQRYQECLSKLSYSDLVSNMQLNESLGTILKETGRAMNASMVAYWEVDTASLFIECKVFWRDNQIMYAERDENRLPIPALPIGCLDCNCESICQLKKKVVEWLEYKQWYSRDLVDSASLAAERSSGFGSLLKLASSDPFLFTPSFMHGKLQGIIGIQSHNKIHQWDELDTSFNESVLTLISLVIEADRNRKATAQATEYSRQLQAKNTEMETMMKHLSQAQIRAEKSENLKSMFLANISHEIRTPMNAIMGFSELLENPKLSEEKRIEFSRSIRTRSSDLLTILNNVLDYTKLGSGMASLNQIEGNVNEFIDKIISGVRAEARYVSKKEVELVNANELEGGVNIIKADFIRLYQVLTNLLINAIKFTYSGMIKIGCREERDTLLFFVADTGIGIANDKLETIFESFRQADESIHGRFGGSGLGLAICKGNVEMWGGKIWVESELEKGSTFYFTLPSKKGKL